MRNDRKWTSGNSAIASGALVALFAAALQAGAAPQTTIAWEREGTGAFDDTGAAVGTAGDVNCDGYADLIIGIPQDDQGISGSSGSSGSGTVEVWFGSATRTFPGAAFGPADWFTYTGNFGGNFGASVAAGDVNGDGCDDLIASEPFPTFALISPQKVHVFQGPLAHVTQAPDANLPPPDLPEWSATLFQRVSPEIAGQQPVSVAMGDVSGDGLADVIVGQPEASNGQSEEGVVMVWLGSQTFASKPDGTPANVEWMAESNQAGAHLGESVASAFDFNGDGRDDILAGAPDFNGVGWAFLWLGSPVLPSAADGTPANKAWSLTTAAPGSRLGASVSSAGDFDGDGFGDVLVGAPNNNSYNFYAQSGEALLARGGNPMPATDTFSFFFGPTTPNAHFGTSVATAGDVNGDGLGDILVGEPDIGLSSSQAGRVHLVLGRRGYTSVFSPAPPTDAVYTAPNTINNVGDKARFGAAVGTAGDWNGDGFSDVIVGAPRFGQSLWGKAYVFLGRGETLATAPVSTLASFQAGAGYGVGVSFAGDINHDGFTDIVAGVPNYDGGQTDEGKVYVNYGGPCGPDCAPFFELDVPGQRESNQAGAQLGYSVSTAGDVNGDGFADVIAGAPLYDTEVFCGRFCFQTVPNIGLVQVYYGSAGGLGLTEAVVLTGPAPLFDAYQAEARYGYSVANAGDVNGDGYGDVLVAAPYFDGPAGADEGRVYLYLGSASGLTTSPSWFASGGQAGARFGIDVATAGDVDGDGFSDVVIGADGYGATGAAFIYRGRPTNASFPQGLAATPIRTLTGQQAGSSFGTTVATAGDLNRDGLSDVVVGAPTFLDDPDFGPQIGAAYVFHGKKPAGPDPTPTIVLFGEYGAGARFGSGAAGAGDLNGDGFGDLVIGDNWFVGNDGFAQGRAYVYHGSPTGIPSTTAVRTLDDCPHSFCDFGRDVAGAGDVNGDGFSDVLVGAYRFSSNATDAGAVFVHLGNERNGSPVTPLQSLGFGGSPLALLGATANWFDASLALKSPAGRSRVVLEVENKPLGQNFDGLNTVKSVALDNVLNPRTSVTLLGNPGSVLHWRARLRSASPLFGRSRWVSLPESAPRETDIRVVPEPGLGIALAVGLGGVAVAARRRRRAEEDRRAR